MFLLFSNGIGPDDDEIRTGNAMVLDPYGETIAESRALGDAMGRGRSGRFAPRDVVGTAMATRTAARAIRIVDSTHRKGADDAARPLR
jgi:hypothetical protein